MPHLFAIAAESTAANMIGAAILLLACAGCSIQDVFRSTLGGVNSDQASLNKINPSNGHSYPEDDNRTVWRMPGADK
jgi:hypothetical protein